MSSIRKFTSLPVQIEAIELTWENWNDIVTWMSPEAFGNGTYIGADGKPTEDVTETIGLFINTLEGQMLARQGDYIIKGTKGEFYLCKPDIFLQKYVDSKAIVKPKFCDDCSCGKATGCGK